MHLLRTCATPDSLLLQCLIDFLPFQIMFSHCLLDMYITQPIYQYTHTYYYTMLGHNLDFYYDSSKFLPFKLTLTPAACMLVTSYKHLTTSHFRAYSALCETPTGHSGIECVFSAADKRSRCIHILNSTHTHIYYQIFPLLHHLSHACTLSANTFHKPLQMMYFTTYRTLKGTPIDLVHTLSRAVGSKLYSSRTRRTTSLWPYRAAQWIIVYPSLPELWSRDSILGAK